MTSFHHQQFTMDKIKPCITFILLNMLFQKCHLSEMCHFKNAIVDFMDEM